MAHDDHAPRVQVLHVTAPTCWWSWGYEGVLNRLRLVYGDQIGIRLVTLRVQPSERKEYMEHYGLTEKELLEWRDEAADAMGVPLAKGVPDAWFPDDNWAPTLAVLAARGQGDAKASRFMRGVLRRCVVEAQDVTPTAVLQEAAREAGLDLARFERDLADREARMKDFETQGDGMPHAPLAFYNLAVTDAEGTTVLLDYAFDPGRVERAVDFVGRGLLKKANPTDIPAYLRHHGPTPAGEIATVFGLSLEGATERMGALERDGAVTRTTLADEPFWLATGPSKAVKP